MILVEGEKLKMQEKYENIKNELVNTKEELKKKVNQLTQVTNMKKMI